MFCGGIVLFILSLIHGTGPSEPENTDLYYRANDQLDTYSYEFKLPDAESVPPPTLVSLGDSTKPLMAMYLMPAAACGNCLNEVDEYIELINDKYSDLNLDQIIWFHGKTEKYTRQFAIIADFHLPTVYSLTVLLPPELTVFKNETRDSQLIVIDKTDEQVLFKILLPKGAMSPVKDKEDILDELAALLESRTQ